MTDSPFTIYKIADVAEKLGKSKRWIEDFLRQNPCGRRAGRTRLFTDEDLARLVAMLPRDDLKVRPRLLTQKRGRNRATASGARTLGPTSIALLERLSKPRCKPPPRPKKKTI